MQPSALPAGSFLGPQQPADRRRIVPLMGSGTSGGGGAVVAQSSVGSPETAPRKASYTANLEAQVRVLEQEVHLLRTGLEQNERLRDVSATDAPLPQRSSSSSKRVHFGPTPVVVPSQSPHSARVSSGVVTGVDGRPRLAFGQRVDSTNSRISAHGPPNAASLQARRVASLSRPSRTSARSGSVPSPSPPATTTTFVHLSSAPASLRGGNPNGVPLQGAATGGTLFSPTAANTQPSASLPAGSPSTSTAAATVWASADPSRLCPPVATTAAALSHYPFRTTTTSSPAPSFTAAISDPPVPNHAQLVSPLQGTSSAAASPIVVAMSSDGPPLASSTQPGTPTAAPVTEATLSPTAALVAPSAPSPPVAGTALAVAHPLLCATTSPFSMAATTTPAEASAPPVASSSAPAPVIVTQPETEVLVLRDTLAQREALLHRVLLELHNRHGSGGAHRQSSPAVTASEVNERQQSRQAMRLLAEELFATQTQLSHARISHQLLLAELHTCRQQVHGAPSPEQQRTAASERTSPAEVSQPSPGPLQEQLDIALRKLKAWEDWYATSATAAGEEAAEVTAGNSNTISTAKGSSSPPEPSPKPKAPNAAYQVGAAGAAAVSGPHTKKSSPKRDKHMYETSALTRYAHGGFGLPGVVPACAIASCPGHGSSLPAPSALAPQRSPAAAPSVPYASAYALDSCLLHHLTSRCDGSGVGAPGSAEVKPEVAVKTSGGAATPPPPPEDASSASSPAQRDEAKGTSGEARAMKKMLTGTGREISRAGVCDASSMWAVPMGGTSIVGSGGAGGGATSSLYVSPYCDRLNHAQQHAYRAQRCIEQLARGAAVRELAEAERQAAEQRLSFWEHHHPYTKGLSAVSPASPSLVPSSSTPDGPRSSEVGKQEVVE